MSPAGHITLHDGLYSACHDVLAGVRTICRGECGCSGKKQAVPGAFWVNLCPGGRVEEREGRTKWEQRAVFAFY